MAPSSPTVSTAAISAAIDRFQPVLRSVPAERAESFARQLWTLADALDSSHAVRAALANPNYPATAKIEMARRLVRGADDEVIDLVTGMVRSRWSTDQEFADGVSRLAYECAIVAAETRGVLEQVENELFEFERILVGSRDLRIQLGDPDFPVERRVAAATAVLDGRVNPLTLLLVQRVCAALRGRHIPETLRWIIMHCAQRRHRLLAEVTAAVPLTEAQLQRLGAILERAYGRKVQLNVSIDPEVIGGVKLQVGSDAMDGTVAGRLAEVRRQLTA